MLTTVLTADNSPNMAMVECEAPSLAPFALSSAQLSAPITVQHSYHVTKESRDCDVSGLLTLLLKIFVSPSARKGNFLAVTKFLYDQSHRPAFESKGA